MRLLDAVDQAKKQYRAFRLILRRGAEDLGLRVFTSESVSALLQAADKGDIIFVPAYGAAINALRQGVPTEGLVAMVDLKGPAGIDAALMLNARLPRFIYFSPLIGDPDYAAYFQPLVEQGVKIFPLPYFPGAPLLEETKILDDPIFEPFSARPVTLAFAGSVWGRRKDYLIALEKTFPGECLIRERLSPPDYLRFLRRSRAGLDLAGSEAVTYRFAEILLAGAVCLFEERPFFVLPPCPVVGEEIVLFRNAPELLEAVARLRFPTRYEGLAKRGFIWYRATQTSGRYVRYLIDIAEGSREPVTLPVIVGGSAPEGFWCQWD